MLSKKLLNILTVSYILILIFSFFYVKSVVSTERIKIEERPEPEKVEDIKPVKVFLQVETPTSQKTYQANLNTSNTFEDLLQELKKTYGFQYEKNYYISGAKLLEVNKLRSDTENEWQIFQDNIDITSNLENLKLIDNAHYKIVFTRI